MVCKRIHFKDWKHYFPKGYLYFNCRDQKEEGGLLTWPNKDDRKFVRIWPKNFHNDLIFLNWLKFMTLITLTLPQKNLLVRSAWTGPPDPARRARTGWDTCPASLCYSTRKKKTSGTEVRRIWDVKIRFVGFIRFVGLNYVHIKKIRFVNVIVRSYSFGHLDSVKWITLRRRFIHTYYD